MLHEADSQESLRIALKFGLSTCVISLRQAASAGHICGQVLPPSEYAERSALLDTLLVRAGRQPGDVARTMTLPLFCGRSEAEFEQQASWLRTMNPAWADLPIMDIFDALRPMFGSLIVGTPTEAAERLRAYAAAGVSEVMLQWGGFDDIEGLHLIANEVIPLLAE